jgi:hypothetical protein
MTGNGQNPKQKACNTALATLAVAGLATYVLACTSFSPDDSKVAFPAFDPKTGDVGISVYDRESHQTNQLFVVSRFQGPEGTERQPVLMRPQWLADGKGIVTAWPGYSDNDDDVLNVAVLAPAGQGAVRLFAIPGITDAQVRLMLPLPIAHNRLFVLAESNRVVRLDLGTGETSNQLLHGEKAALWPAPVGEGIYYVADDTSKGGAFEIGRLDPDTLAQTVVWRKKSRELDKDRSFALSPDGKRIALVEGKPGKQVLRLWRGEELEKTVPLDFSKETVHLGLPVFSPFQDVLFASYLRAADNERKAVCGLLEISLKDGALRRLPLMEGLEDADEDSLVTFQVCLSHDGKTAALCSTYLAEEAPEEFKAENCALFLVDLSSPDRKVTRVPLPLPKKPTKAKEAK